MKRKTEVRSAKFEEGGRAAPGSTPEALRRRIADDDLTFTFARSGGPGGQNVNKVNTKVTLWFDLGASVSLADDEKTLLSRRLAGRIGRDGRLRVSVTRHRTQAANRAEAVKRFFELLADALTTPRIRKPTRVSRGAKERRLRAKRQHALRKTRRTGTPIDE